MDTISKLFEELGGCDGVSGVLFHPGDRSWTIGIDPETRVGVAPDAAGETLNFSLDLGAPGPQEAEGVHRMLLRFSYLWRETGGLFAALDERGRPVLMYRCAAAGLDVPALHRLVTSLAENRRAWTALIDGAAEHAAGADIAPPQGGIRV